MIAYIVRRLLILPITLFGMSVIIFLFLQTLGPEERAGYYLTASPRSGAVLEGIILRYGLRDPMPVQYWNWLVGRTDPDTGKITGGLLRGNLGYSRFGGRPVAELIRVHFPATVELALYSLIPIILLGVWMGTRSAAQHNRRLDRTIRVISIVGYSLPSFITGLILLMVFYAEWNWFPAGRVSDWVHMEVLAGTFTVRTGLITIDALWNGRWDVWWDAIRHLVLPVTTLSYISIAAFLRITRSSMLEALHQDYVVTARAKGLPEEVVVSRHALPNALLPVVTYTGLIAAASLSGVVITESVFNFPGMGYAAAQAAAQFDVITVLGFAMLSGIVLITINLAVDIIYAVLDPRIRLH